MFNNCYPCCGVLAVALRNWGPTLNCWNYSGWDYPARQQWATSGYTELNGNPGLGQAASATLPGAASGVLSNPFLSNVFARVMVSYAESSSRLKLRLTHRHPTLGGQGVNASEIEVEYEKSHASGAPRSRHDTGTWMLTPQDVIGVSSSSFGQPYTIANQDIGELAWMQKAATWDFTGRTYSVVMTCGAPTYQYPPDTCGNRTRRSMVGVNGHAFELTVDQPRLGHLFDYVCESDPTQAWSRRAMHADAYPGVDNATVLHPIGGPLKVTALGGYTYYTYPSPNNCATAVLNHDPCPTVNAAQYGLTDAKLAIHPYAWMAFSQNNVLSGYAPLGTWSKMQYPGTDVFGDLTFSVELIP